MHSPLKRYALRALVLACPALGACFNPTETPDAATDGSADTTGGPTGSTSPSSTDPSNTDPSTTSPSTTDDPSNTDPSTTSPSTTVDPSDTDASDTDASDTDASSEGSSTDTSVTGDPTCDGQCAPDVPQGWQGPVVLSNAAELVPCPGEFPQTVHDGRFTGLNEGAAMCDCECGNVSGATCGAATLREEANNCIQFIPNPDTWVLNPGACVVANAPADDYSLSEPTLNTSNASCAPQATEEIDEPTWDREFRTCGTAPGDACEGGSCFPAIPDDHRMCIWVEGEVGCPAGEWADVLVSYAEATDERDCSTCTCGTPQGTCGGAAVMTNQGCGVIYVDEIPTGGCGDFPAFTHLQYTAEIEASCSPSGGDLIGDVTTSGTITYCCI